MKVFYLEDSTPQGPIPASELMEMVERGQLPTELWVCVAGGSQWEHYLDWFERQPKPTAAPPPPPSPPPAPPPPPASQPPPAPNPSEEAGGLPKTVVLRPAAATLAIRAVPGTSAGTPPPDPRQPWPPSPSSAGTPPPDPRQPWHPPSNHAANPPPAPPEPPAPPAESGVFPGDLSGLRMAEPVKREAIVVAPVKSVLHNEAAGPIAVCAVCHKTWAEHLTSPYTPPTKGKSGKGAKPAEAAPAGRICRLCSARENEVKTAVTERSQAMRMPNLPWMTLGIIGFAALFGGAIFYYLLPLFFTGKRHPSVTVYESWSGREPDKWPPIVLVNEAKLKDQPAVRTSLSVLIRRPVDVIGCTAGTVLGGKNNTDNMNALLPADARPQLTPRELGPALISWTAGAPGVSKDPVKFTAVAGLGESMNYKSRMFVTDATKKNRPVELLATRSFFASGNPCVVLYVPPGTKQQRGVKGTVTRLGNGEVLSVALESPIPALGLAGAPVLDLGGQLGGIVYAAEEAVSKDGTVKKLLAEPTSNFNEWMAFK